jgi:hypothetical protein
VDEIQPASSQGANTKSLNETVIIHQNMNRSVISLPPFETRLDGLLGRNISGDGKQIRGGRNARYRSKIMSRDFATQAYVWGGIVNSWT